MNEHIRQTGKQIADTVKESSRRAFKAQLEDRYQKGFTRATSITLRLIQAKLDVFQEQMKGRGLNKGEQSVYAQLSELKTEIEADYDRYWQGSDVDWRPLKPVVKAAIRQIEE
ncbi:hypothetical protein [Glutamicibacter protophormiae]|uniref:hypothetical protein n=1 Tax=Glutamicibacter protophormiae TaxID=37930 RepID=UPI003A942FA9